ncbi:MAG: lamin tail domain-containing protein [Bacteroidetes bacterium]|nr:lamin tail domain-containing protein [Bacteroidota bacterium]
MKKVFSKFVLILLLSICYLSNANAQVVINEAGNRNASQITDEEGKYEDWLELYNSSTDTMHLYNYALSDDVTDLAKWTFPNIILSPSDFLLIYASGKDRKPTGFVNHWETVAGDLTYYDYIVPTAATESDWMNPDYITGAEWLNGKASIGFADSDDSSLIASTSMSVYLRFEFTIDDTSLISAARFFMDYDDGFIAYINGTAFAMDGLSGTPDYNAASSTNHEALLYQGYDPDEFYLDWSAFKLLVVEGTNVFAVQVHNNSEFSTDLTAKPFLLFGIADSTTLFDATPDWFDANSDFDAIHTNFKIAPEGETIFLSNADGIMIDSVFVINQQTDNSYGRATDGATDFAVFEIATPNASNNTSTPYLGYMEMPTFDSIGGFYNDSLTIGITCPNPLAEIYYTTDGNTPTTDDNFYSEAITLFETTALKAVCVDEDENYLQSKPHIETYFIEDAVSLPVISITTDEENLFGDNGIYDYWWLDWKKPCYIEYFNEDKIKQFGWNSAIKIDGGAGGSRSLPQKSFRIEPFNDSYGDGVLNYPLIPRKWFVQNYETFYLRNGSNFWNVLPYKDAFMERTLDGTLNDPMAYTPVIVYLNGEYWGLYELREKLDPGRYKQANLIEKDDLDLLSMSYWYGLVLRTLRGSDTSWYNMRDFIYEYPTPEDTLFYNLADAQLDLKSFADYMIAETWMGNYDWPWNNIKMYRDRGGDNKWKYAVIDLEWGIGYGWSNIYSDMISYMMDYNEYTCPIITLMSNPQFHDYFINRYADLMNSTFLPERTLAIEDSIFSQVMPAMGRQLDTWGDGSPILDQIAVFLDYRSAVRSDFEFRTPEVRNHLEDYFDLEEQNDITLQIEPEGAGRIQLNTLTIYDSGWEGVYFQAVPITMTAEANTGYTFSHWSAHPLIDDETIPGQTLNLNYNTTFTAVFTGSAMPEEITVSEINYNSEASVDAGDWIELYNYGEAEVNISKWKIQDSNPLHEFIIPDGIHLLPGERLVLVEDTALFKTENPDITNFIGPIGFGFSGETDFVKLFTQQDFPKVEIQYFDSLPWPKGADAQGRTLELNNPETDLNNPLNWFDGCIGGSPGMPYTPCDVPLVFSEINYHSSDTLDANDWVEVWNISDNAIDISNWIFMDDSIGDEHTYIIPEGRILNPDERWVFAQTLSKFTAQHPFVTNYDASFYFNLNGNGEWIRMYDTSGRLQLSVYYNDKSPWPIDADGAGYTLELVDAFGKMNAGENWTTICMEGSPGTAPSEPCEVEDTVPVFTQELIVENILIYPNPASNYLAIESDFPKSSTLKIQLISLEGAMVKIFYDGIVSAGSQTFYCNLESINAGVYLVEITINGNQFIEQLVKL